MSAANPNATTTSSSSATTVVGSSSSSAMNRQRAELKFDKYGKSPTATTQMNISGSGVGGVFSAGASSDAATPGGSPVAPVKEKRMTMRAVRNIIRLGRSRQNSQTRDSSTEDEGR